MTQKYMKSGFVSLALDIVKTTRRSILPLNWQTFGSLVTPSLGKDVGEWKMLNIASRSVNWHNHFAKIWQYLANLNIFMSYHPGVVVLGTHPSEILAHFYENAHNSLVGFFFFFIIKKKEGKKTETTQKLIDRIWIDKCG